MPKMADLSVKKADGTTTVVYNALTAAGGDKTAAQWAFTAASTTPALRPFVKCISRNGEKGSNPTRVVALDIVFPEVVTDPQTAMPTVVARSSCAVTFRISQRMTEPAVKELVHQATNILTTALIREVATVGYAPTA